MEKDGFCKHSDIVFVTVGKEIGLFSSEKHKKYKEINKKVNRKVKEVPQSQIAANSDTKR